MNGALRVFRFHFERELSAKKSESEDDSMMHSIYYNQFIICNLKSTLWAKKDFPWIKGI